MGLQKGKKKILIHRYSLQSKDSVVRVQCIWKTFLTTFTLSVSAFARTGMMALSAGAELPGPWTSGDSEACESWGVSSEEQPQSHADLGVLLLCCFWYPFAVTTSADLSEQLVLVLSALFPLSLLYCFFLLVLVLLILKFLENFLT